MAERKRERVRLARLEHRWGRPFKAIFHELRIVRGLDMDGVARECGVTRKTIWKWLQDAEPDKTTAA